VSIHVTSLAQENQTFTAEVTEPIFNHPTMDFELAEQKWEAAFEEVLVVQFNEDNTQVTITFSAEASNELITDVMDDFETGWTLEE